MNLDDNQVIEAGIDVVRRTGWSSLSIRAVARELAVTPMALYRYVADGEMLRRAVIVRIVSGMTAVQRSGDLATDMTLWAQRARGVLQPFPGAAGYLLTAWFEIPSVLGMIEDLLDLVHEHGLAEFEAVAAVNAVFMYVLMRAEAERDVRDAKAVRRVINLAGAERDLPRLRSLVRYYTTAQFDAHFDYGLRLLVTGLLAKQGASV
jgi:AcrR family transcriptional regulator